MNSLYETSETNKRGFNIPSPIVDLLQSIVVAISICIILYLFILTPNQITGDSMEPNFLEGEIVLTNKLVNWMGETDLGKSLSIEYKKGDVVVFQKPGLDDYIKRIVAVPGERVAIRDGYVYVNNKRILEEYLLPATFTKGASFIEDGGEGKIVPEDEFLLLGDNRSDSLDSRYNEIGFVKKEWLKGKVVLIYWPLNRLKIVNTGEIDVIN